MSRPIILLYMMICMAPASAEMKDPTRPVSFSPELEAVQQGTGASGGSMQVSSIIIGKERRVAIINGQSVQKGDAIHGMKVLAIKPSEVLLKSDNKELQVSLLPKKVKIPVDVKGDAK